MGGQRRSGGVGGSIGEGRGGQGKAEEGRAGGGLGVMRGKGERVR